MTAEKNSSLKYALITGATSGLGYEFAKLLALDGYGLILVARSEQRLQEVAGELERSFDTKVVIMVQDLFNPVSPIKIYLEVKKMALPVHILINNAGQGEHGRFTDYRLARDVDIIQLNVTSLVSLTKYFLKDMVARNEGRILQVASLVGKYPTPFMTVYAATKAFVISFTEGLISELKDTHVTMTVLMPGATDTDFYHKAGAEDTASYREQDLSSPVDVARDGYNALMSGAGSVISGFKNKVYAAVGTVLPDTILASAMRKQMSQSDEQEGREAITQEAANEEAKEAGETRDSSGGDNPEKNKSE